MMNAVWRTSPGTCCDDVVFLKIPFNAHFHSKFLNLGWLQVNALAKSPVLQLN